MIKRCGDRAAALLRCGARQQLRAFRQSQRDTSRAADVLQIEPALAAEEPVVKRQRAGEAQLAFPRAAHGEIQPPHRLRGHLVRFEFLIAQPREQGPARERLHLADLEVIRPREALLRPTIRRHVHGERAAQLQRRRAGLRGAGEMQRLDDQLLRRFEFRIARRLRFARIANEDLVFRRREQHGLRVLLQEGIELVRRQPELLARRLGRLRRNDE